jgi:hypothetical protein
LILLITDPWWQGGAKNVLFVGLPLPNSVGEILLYYYTVERKRPIEREMQVSIGCDAKTPNKMVEVQTGRLSPPVM